MRKITRRLLTTLSLLCMGLVAFAQQQVIPNDPNVRIGKLENGKYNPSLKLAMDIAKVFGKPVEEVFIFEDDSN